MNVNDDFSDQPERDGLNSEHEEKNTEEQHGAIRYPLPADLLKKDDQQH